MASGMVRDARGDLRTTPVAWQRTVEHVVNRDRPQQVVACVNHGHRQQVVGGEASHHVAFRHRWGNRGLVLHTVLQLRLRWFTQQPLEVHHTHVAARRRLVRSVRHEHLGGD